VTPEQDAECQLVVMSAIHQPILEALTALDETHTNKMEVTIAAARGVIHEAVIMLTAAYGLPFTSNAQILSETLSMLQGILNEERNRYAQTN